LVFSSAAFAAEKIVVDGKPGIFIQEEGGKAEEATARIKEHPHLKKQIELLDKQVESTEKLVEIKDKRIEVEQQIAASWKKAFDGAQKEVAERESQDDFRLYIYVALFAGGTIVGAAMMYGSSVVLHNIR
jgi:tRNA splicing endonuclease